MKKVFAMIVAVVATATVAFAANPAPKTVSCGSNVTIKATANAHYHFVKWSDDVTENPRTLTNVTEAKTLQAIFAADNTYTLTLTVTPDAIGHVAIIEGEAPAYYEGDVVKIQAISDDDCWEFAYWGDENSNTNAVRTITFGTSDLSYTAVFTQKHFDVTIESADEVMGTVEFVNE